MDLEKTEDYLSVSLQFRNAKNWESSLKFKWLARQATKGDFVFSKVFTWLFLFLSSANQILMLWQNLQTLPLFHEDGTCSLAPPSSSCHSSWRTPGYFSPLFNLPVEGNHLWNILLATCCPSQLFPFHAAAATCDSSKKPKTLRQGGNQLAARQVG